MTNYWEAVRNYKLQFPELSTAIIRAKIKDGDLDYTKPKVIRSMKSITEDDAVDYLMKFAGYTRNEATEYYSKNPLAAKQIMMRMKGRAKKPTIKTADAEQLMKLTGYSRKEAEEYVAKREEYKRLNKIEAAKMAAARRLEKAKAKKEIKYHNEEPKGAKKTRAVKLTNEIISRLASIPKVKRASKKVVLAENKEPKGAKKSRAIEKINMRLQKVA